MNTSRLRIAMAWPLLVLLVVGCNKRPAAPSDQTITSDIQAKLFQDPVLKTRDIQVTTQSGVVTLAGSVNSDQEKAAVEQIANQEGGVKQVVDQLAVQSAAQAQATQAQATPPAQPAPPAAPKAPARRHRRHSSEMARAAPQAAPAQSPAANQPAPAPPPPAAAPVENQPAEPAAPAAPPTVTIPAGTPVTVRMIDSVDSATADPGQVFSASLAAPLVVGNTVAAPANSNATVRLVSANSSGRVRGSAEVGLELNSLTVNGTTYRVRSGLYTATGSSRGKSTAEAAGGGGVLGGLIGAIAGRGAGADHLQAKILPDPAVEPVAQPRSYRLV
jgi:BON domain